MLGDGLRLNGVLFEALDQTQKVSRDKILDNIENGVYEDEFPCCPTCNNINFEPLAEKDRYGIPYRLVQCRVCGLFQVAPRLNATALQDFYANHYRSLYHGAYTAQAAHSKAAEERGRVALKLLADINPVTSKANIVEIGCAAGSQLLPFKWVGCDVRGYDFDENIATLGRQEHNLDLRNGGLAECMADIESGASRPDAVLYIHVFEHLSDPRAELDLLSRVLAPDGLLYLEVPGLSSALRNREVFHDQYFEIGHNFHFDASTLKDLVESCGWTCLYVDNYVRAVLAPPSFSAIDPESALETLRASEHAKQLVQAGIENSEPSEICESLLLAGASNAQANFMTGELLFDQKNLLCLDYLEAAHKLEPTRGKYTFTYGRALISFPGAANQMKLEVLGKASSQLPGEPYPLFHFGCAMYEARRYDEAIGIFASAIRLKTDVSVFHYRMGLAWRAVSHPARATESFRKALELDPTHSYSNYELGRCYAMLGLRSAARDAFKAAISINNHPQFVKALSKLEAEEA